MKNYLNIILLLLFCSISSYSNAQINVSHIITNADCHASCTASSSAIVNGGNPPFSYSWSNGMTNSIATNLCAGSYQLTVTDSSGNQNITTIIITEPSPIVSAITSSSDSCSSSTGTASVVVTGGIPPYLYNWSTGTVTASIGSLAAGTYGLTITDANACQANNNVSIGNNCGQTNLNLSTTSIVNASCANTCDGEATVSVSGGQAPYSYLWSDGQSVAHATGLCAGTYTLIVTDDNGLQATSSITITSPIPLIAAITSNQTTVCNNNSVLLVGTASGATGNFSYQWYMNGIPMSGANSPNLQVNQAGTYCLEVSDGICQTMSSCIQISSSSGQSSVFASQTSICSGDSSILSAANTACAGNCSYQWFWNGNILTGATSMQYTAHVSGLYSCEITDINGCSSSDSITITPCNNFTISGTITDVLCHNQCDGSINVQPSGGAAPYIYTWSNGATTQTLNNLCAGVYTVSVEDANASLLTMTYVITEPLPLTITGSVINANCGAADGEIFVAATGGIPLNYSYTWSNGVTTEINTNLAAGMYTVTVIDANGCAASQSFQVNESSFLNVSHSISPANCSDLAGAITQNLSGTYSYLWNTGDTTASISNLAAGLYACTISAATGCSQVEYYQVPQDSSCLINISGYVYNVSLSSTCSPSGATPVAFTLVRLQPLGLTTFTDANGFYDFNISIPGNYTLEFTNPTGLYNLLCPTGNIAINNTTLGTSYPNNNFYVTSPNAQDLRIDLSHFTTATPGFGLWTNLSFCNDGQVTMSGTIDYVYDAQLDFDQVNLFWGVGSPALIAHDSINHILSFSFGNLVPGQCGYFSVDFVTPVTVPLGNIIGNAATIYPLSGDATPANNVDVDTLTVIGSWDPNEKLAGPLRAGDERGAGLIYADDNTLDYTIHFQNLGTAPAYRVEVRDTLEANLLPESIRNIQASHNVQVEIEEGNILVFIFDNINLPHADADERGSNGFVKFRIDRVAGLALGSRIDNNAAIYFDFNAPVITNMTEVTISDPTSIQRTKADVLEAKVYPNPFQEVLNIEYELAVDTEVTIAMHDALGRQIRTYQVNQALNAGSHNFQINTEELAAAVYYLSIETPEGQILQKVVKQ